MPNDGGSFSAGKTELALPHYINFNEYINSGIFVKNNINFLPALHGRLEFGIAAGILSDMIRPDCVAVELPSALKRQFMDSVKRLPYISAICVESRGVMQYHLVEPQDAAVAAVRKFGASRENDVHLIDYFCEDYREHFDAFPDPHAIKYVGFEKYCSEFYASQEGIPLDSREHEDLLREQFMAASLQQLSLKYNKILFICGLYHYPAIFKMLDYKNAIPLVRPKIDKTYMVNLSEESHRSILSETPFIIRHFETPDGGLLPGTVKDPAAAAKTTENGATVINFMDILNKMRSSTDAGGDKTFKAPVRPHGTQAAEEKLKLEISQIEKFYSFDAPGSIDREALDIKLARIAAAKYLKNTGDAIAPPALAIMFKFLKNYLKYKGLLAPTLYELITGARAAVDDNYAYEVYETATEYPWLDRSNHYATLDITLNDLKIDGKTVRFHRRLKSMRQMLEPRFKMRKSEGKKGEWLKEWNENQDSICSYQPEDLIIENFGNFLRKKARVMLTDEQARIEPFTSSLMDGIDMRETIRNFHIDKKLYVKIGRHVSGKAGSVVFIFDDDAAARSPFEPEKYPCKMTWLGEHHQESDMAFYSTEPGEKIVGPGISRCEYGGFMLSFPPLRLYDVWNDPYYYLAKNKPEILLMAAIDYSLEKYVVYCAKKPPRSLFKSIAAKVGKKIVYVPMGQFSPNTIQKLQTVHILAGKATRANAKDYIW